MSPTFKHLSLKVWNYNIRRQRKWNPNVSEETRAAITQWTGIALVNHESVKYMVCDFLGKLKNIKYMVCDLLGKLKNIKYMVGDLLGKLKNIKYMVCDILGKLKNIKYMVCDLLGKLKRILYTWKQAKPLKTLRNKTNVMA